MPIWNPIAEAPAETDLQIGVGDTGAVHALFFACRKTASGWVKTETGKLIDVQPTHWRLWTWGVSHTSSIR